VEYPLETLTAIIAQATVSSCRFPLRRVAQPTNEPSTTKERAMTWNGTDYYATLFVASRLNHTQRA
jgi:hypothetical protein